MNKTGVNLHGFEDTRQYLYAGLLKILGDGGLAIRDGFDASSAQRDYAQRWCETIARSDERLARMEAAPASVMLASADTGTGKTIGYGVPLLLRAAMGKKVVISTHTHALQKQFIGTSDKQGDIVRIAGWIKELGLGNLRIARRLGRHAFISLSALELVISKMKESREQLQLTVQDFTTLQPLIDFAVASNAGKCSGLIEDIREQLGGSLPFKITASSIGLGADSDSADNFCYDAHLESAENADVVIVSHAYLAAAAAYRHAELLQSPVDALVIDEADRLADVAASAFRFELSLRRSAASVDLLPGVLAERAKQGLTELANYAQSLFSSKMAITFSDLLTHQQITLSGLVEKSKKEMTAVIAAAQKSDKIGRDALKDLQAQGDILSRFSAAIGSGSGEDVEKSSQGSNRFAAAISYSPVHSLPSLMVMPLSPGRLMAKFWNLGRAIGEQGASSAVSSVLLTSATLGAPGYYPNAAARFQSLAGDLGISLVVRPYQACEYDLWCNFEPEDFGKVRFILSDPSVPDPVSGVDEDARAVVNPAWLDYSVRMVVAAHQAGGRTLVLVNSYDDAEAFASGLLGKVGCVVQQMRGQSTKDCENAFLADERSVWISPTAWEGLNLPGAISNLVIPRLPFQPPDPSADALLRSLGELTDVAVSKIQSARRMNALKRKLRQGMFRPIRSKADRARIWIGDPRFPMAAGSQISLKFPARVRFSSGKRYPGLHLVVPTRFQLALQNAEVLTVDGDFLKSIG